MNLDTLFSIGGALATLGWVLLVFVPRWKPGAWLIAGVILPLVLGLAYLGLIAGNFFGAEGGFGSLAEVRLLFENDALLLAGWLHYLAFDLFIGAWEVRDAQRHGIPHLAVIPCLVLTFLFGPIGLLLYFGIRGGIKRRIAVGDEA